MHGRIISRDRTRSVGFPNKHDSISTQVGLYRQNSPLYDLLLLVENWLSQQMFLVVRRLLISTLRMVEREEEVCECRGSAAK